VPRAAEAPIIVATKNRIAIPAFLKLMRAASSVSCILAPGIFAKFELRLDLKNAGDSTPIFSITHGEIVSAVV